MIGRTRWLGTAVAVLALVVVAVVARSHPSHPVTQRAHDPAGVGQHQVVPPPKVVSTATATVAPERRPHGSGSGFPPWLGSLLLALIAAGAVLALGRFTRGHWGFSRADRGRHGSQGVELPDAPPVVRADLADAVEQGLDDLTHGAVTEAIIACWLRVETAAGAAGVAVRPSETSTEFVDRVLVTFGAREQSLRRMSALYREARFSSHVMTEAGREEARRCLQEIRDDLGSAHADA